MAFAEMVREGRNFVAVGVPPDVKLVAGLGGGGDSSSFLWKLFTWPSTGEVGPPPWSDEKEARLTALYGLHAKALAEGQPLPWYTRSGDSAVFYVRPLPAAQVVPLRPSQPPPPKLDVTAQALVAMAQLAGEARVEANRLRALALQFDDLARRLEP
jgi:hypothetical protein